MCFIQFNKFQVHAPLTTIQENRKEYSGKQMLCELDLDI